MSVVAHIAARRQLLSTVRGRTLPRRRTFARQMPPRAVEQSYAARLLHLVGELREQLRAELTPHLAAWAEESQRLHGVRKDDAGDALRLRIADVRYKLEHGAFSAERLKLAVRPIAERTSEHQKRELQRQLVTAVGVEVPILDKQLGARVEAFTSENVGLIQSLPTQALDQVQRVLMQGFSQGERAEALAEQLEERLDVTESRAAIIARDQVGKFFGSLNRARQTDLGLTHFYWATAGDERVRPEHEALDGKRFSWAAGAPEEGFPGGPVMCRCTPEPDVDGLLDSL